MPPSIIFLASLPLVFGGIQPFSLSQVTLDPTHRFSLQRMRNLDQLLSLNLTDVLCEYTASANLTGTWAAPTCKKLEGVQYFGHYTGHYLSALSFLYNATGDSRVLQTSSAAISTLHAAQRAWGSVGGVYMGGYLFPYTFDTFANLFDGQSCAPTCVPWYVYHKMLAGLLDQHVYAGSAEALMVALGMAAWCKAVVEGILSEQGGQDRWQASLNIEWGGQNDALMTLFDITRDPQWLQTALYFEHYTWTRPLAENIDDLNGNHANTHIPEVVGDSRIGDGAGNTTKLTIASNFFSIVTSAHSYATGGSSSGEMWGAANQLGDGLGDRTEESCTTYNIIKLSRAAFLRTGNSSFLDHYERAFMNGLLGNMATHGQYDASTHTVGWIYMLPMGGSESGQGLRKPWGSSNGWLACCWGTLSETFAKNADSIFFFEATPTAATLFVSLFVGASVTFPAAGGESVVVTQQSSYPYNQSNTATILVTSISQGATAEFTLAIRVPFWATSPLNTVMLNGSPYTSTPATPGTFLNITRTWGVGDSVCFHFVPFLRFEQLQDNRPQYQGVGALLWGGTLLAAVNSTSDRVPLLSTEADALAARVTRLDPGSTTTLLLSLATTGFNGVCGAVPLVPLADIEFEAYTVYFHTEGWRGHVVGPTTSPAVVPGGGVGQAALEDWVLGGGASVLPLGDPSSSTSVLRSGAPGPPSTAQYFTLLNSSSSSSGSGGGSGGGGGIVAGLSFSYRYASGTFPPTPHSPPSSSSPPRNSPDSPTSFSLVATAFSPCTDVPGPTLATLYTSPPLGDYPFHLCTAFTPAAPGGFLAAGDDLWSASLTVPAAESACNANASCLAFTFSSPDVAPSTPVNIYFKSAVNFVAAPGWQTYVSTRVSEASSSEMGDGEELERRNQRRPPPHRVTAAVASGMEGAGGKMAVGVGVVASSAAAAATSSQDPASCFSPPILVNLSGLALNVSGGVELGFIFDNNQANVRLLLPLDLQITWA